MQYTSNFNFMVAEGTDTVNLLTQCYPNFTSLDSILQAIKEQGVTAATSTKTGTVHAIVRVDADCNVIRWVNTANYAAGDTFTVDGVSVTATAMNGTSLPDGAFVINQSSMAILNGSVLTFVGVAGISSVAAQNVTYDNTGSGLVATDVQNAIDEVLGDIPANAAALSYDNTVSGLTATDVQAAIDEVYAAVPVPGDVSVTADGVKTNRQLLDALYALIDFTKLTKNSKISYNVGTTHNYYELIAVDDTTVQYSKATATSNWGIQHVILRASGSDFYQCSAGNITNAQATVPTTGIVWKIEY